MAQDLPTFEPRTWDDPQTEEFQRTLERLWARMADLPFWDGELQTVENVGSTSASATFTVRHALGRVPRGYIVLGGEVDATTGTTPSVFQHESDDDPDASTIRIRAAGLWKTLLLWIW